MVLPTTPGSSLSLDQIQTEFGGTNPIAISEYVSEVGKTAAAGQNVAFSDFSGLSSTAAVTLNGFYTVSAFALNTGGAFAGIQFQTDGDIMRGLSPTSRTVSFPTDIGDWVSNKTGLVSGDYEWRVGNLTDNSPSLSGAAITIPTSGFSSWQNFSANFGYYFAIYGFRSCGFDLEIRIDNGTAVSTAITLSTEV